MKSTMLQYDNAVEAAVERLIAMGIFKSKADIFRVGAIELAAKYGAVKTQEEILDEMMLRDAQGAYKKAKAGKGRFYRLEDL